jgi:hypothetical protein
MFALAAQIHLPPAHVKPRHVNIDLPQDLKTWTPAQPSAYLITALRVRGDARPLPRARSPRLLCGVASSRVCSCVSPRRSSTGAITARDA